MLVAILALPAFALTPSARLSAATTGAVRGPALSFAAPTSAQQRTSPLYASAGTTTMVAAAQEEPASTSLVGPIANLAKNIVGSGVLALAAGIAAFSGSKLALLPSMCILLFTGALSAYTYSLIARVGSAVGSSTYRETWTKVFSEKTAFIPDLTVIFMTLVAGLAYSIIVGDMFSGISKLAGLPTALTSPNAWIGILSVAVLLPLSLMRDLSSLAVGSIIGTAGTVYTMLFIFLRLFDGSYAAGGKFHALIDKSLQPAFAAPTAARPLLNPGMFVLLSMLSSAFLAHYNAPKQYEELAPPKTGSKLARFNIVVGAGFGFAALLMGAIMAGGYLTFGAASQGLILNNYATADPLALVARLGIGLSIIFSYPLNFLGLREGLLTMLKLDGSKTAVHWGATLALMVLMNGTALFMKDLGLVVGLGGAILGSALVYIFPALMAIGEKAGAMGKMEKLANWGLAGLGVFFAVLGSVMCLK